MSKSLSPSRSSGHSASASTSRRAPFRSLQGPGLQPELAATAIETRELRYATRHGQTIWADPRGKHAGLPWPQFSIHRGELQMILFETAQKIVGERHIS